MRRSLAVPGATGALVLVVVYLALAGQQTRADEACATADKIWKDSIAWQEKWAQSFGGQLTPYIIATNAAEKTLLRNFVHSRDISASKAAYQLTLKEEQGKIDDIMDASSKEIATQLMNSYLMSRNGTANPYLTQDPEFRAFFSNKKDNFRDYMTLKVRETYVIENLKATLDKILKHAVAKEAKRRTTQPTQPAQKPVKQVDRNFLKNYEMITKQSAGQQARVAEVEMLWKKNLALDEKLMQKLGSELRLKMIATNQAEKTLIRDFMNKKNISASKAAYEKALKVEQAQVENIMKPTSLEKATQLFNRYLMSRSGFANPSLTLNPEFRPFFSNQDTKDFRTYMYSKRKELESFERLKVMLPIKFQEAAQYAKKNSQQPAKLNTGVSARQQTSGDAYADKAWKDSLAWDEKMMQKCGSELKPKMMATNKAEKVFLRDFMNKKDASASTEAYIKTLKEERKQLKTSLQTETKERARKLYEDYFLLRRGRFDPSLTQDPEFRSFFSNLSGPDLTTLKDIKRLEIEHYKKFELLFAGTPGKGKVPAVSLDVIKRDLDSKKSKKSIGTKERNANFEENKDMRKRRSSLEEKLVKRSNLLKRQEKKAEESDRDVFDLEENTKDKDFMEKFVEEGQDMDIVDRMERNIDKGSAKINHRKVKPDKGDSNRSSGGGDKGVFWFSIVVGIIAEAVVIIVVLLAYRYYIFRRRQIRRSTREAEPLNSDRRNSSKISSATTFSRSTIH